MKAFRRAGLIMLKYLFVLFFAVLPYAALAAPSVTVEAAASAASSTLSGTAGTGDGRYLSDLQDQLGYDKTHISALQLRLQHDLAWLPNLRFAWQGYDAAAGSRQAALVTHSRLQVRQTDLVFYYTPIKRPLRLDLGLGAHRLEVDFALDVFARGQRIQSIHKKADQIFPVLYAATAIDQPIPAVQLHGEAYYSRYKGRELRDANIGLRWTPVPIVGIDLGYRYNRLKFHSDAITIDVTTSGPHLGLSLRF